MRLPLHEFLNVVYHYIVTEHYGHRLDTEERKALDEHLNQPLGHVAGLAPRPGTRAATAAELEADAASWEKMASMMGLG